MRVIIRSLLLLSLASLPACATARPAASAGSDQSTPTTGPTRIRVDNRNFSDMNIYILRSGGDRLRIGTATGTSITVLVIPSWLVSSPTTLRFLADPIGSRVEPVSDEITVSPGDTITLQIPA